MVVAFRADSNIAIGTGHVMRCSHIARALQRLGHSIIFICSSTAGNKNDWLRSLGFTVEEISTSSNIQSEYSSNEVFQHYDFEEDAKESVQKLGKYKPDLVIIDHYSLDARYHKKIRLSINSPIVCLDDLANRQLDCDLLIDQNFRLNENIYDHLTPDFCIKRIGLEYSTILLDEKFRTGRSKAQPRTGAKKNVLIFLGGTDAPNLTTQMLEKLQSNNHFRLNVVVGASNPHRGSIEARYKDHPLIQLYSNINMAELINECDLGVGSGGVSAWERAFLGLPTLLANISDNQDEIASALTNAGAAEFFGTHPNVDVERLVSQVPKIINDIGRITSMSKAAMSLWPNDILYKPSPLLAELNLLLA